MPSKFGGIAIEEETTGSKFGGVPVEDQQVDPKDVPEEYLESVLGEETQADVGFREEMAKKARESGYLDVAASALGKGYMDVARGLGLAKPAGEVEKVYWQEMEREYPWLATGGRIAGEAAPFIPAYMAAAPLAATGTAGTVATAGGLGATEALVTAKGRGEKDFIEQAGIGGAFGIGTDVLFPKMGKLARKLFFKMKGTVPTGALLDPKGAPTPELQSLLNESGLDFEDLSEAAVTAIRKESPDAIPEQAFTKAMFAQEGVEPTQAAITKKATAEAREELLKQQMLEPGVEKYRQTLVRQSEQIKDALNKVVTNEDLREFSTGEMIKDALTNRYDIVHDKAQTLYKTFTESVKDIGGDEMTLSKTDIAGAIPDEDTFKDLMAGSDAARRAIQDLDTALSEFNLKSPLRQFEDEFKEPVQDLTIANFNRLRKRLNAIKKKDISGASSVAINPIIRQLDREAESVANILQKQGMIDKNVVDDLYSANDIWRGLNQEFTEKDLVGKLIKKQSDNTTRAVESSNVYYELAKKGTPFEKVNRVVNSLSKGGDKGQIALQNLQDSTMLDLIEAGFSTKSRTLDGVQMFNPGAFRKRVEQLGEDKLKSIFRGNKEALNKIKNIENIAKRLQPSEMATPKGSGVFVKELLGKTPMAGEILKSLRIRGEVRKSLNTDAMLKEASFLEEFAPETAKALGVAGIVEATREEEDKQ